VAKRKKIWGDTMRVEVGSKHRNGEVGSDELEEEVSTDDFQVQDFTKPTHIDLDVTPPETPVKVVQFLELWDRVDRMKLDAKRSKHSTANQIMQAMGKRPPAERLARIDTKVRIIWALLAFALTAAGASLKSVISYVGDAREEAITIRHLIEQNTDLSVRLRAVEDQTTRSVQRLDDLMEKVK